MKTTAKFIDSERVPITKESLNANGIFQYSCGEIVKYREDDGGVVNGVYLQVTISINDKRPIEFESMGAIQFIDQLEAKGLLPINKLESQISSDDEK